MNKPIKENWTTGDISGFGFAFSLVLLGTILSAYSDHPVFWLLVGTGPLVMGLTVIAFLRHLSNMRRWVNPKPEFKIRRILRLPFSV